MRLSMLSLSIIVLTLAAFLTATAVAQELKGKHKEQGLTCVDCHKTDKPDKPASVEACKECHGGYADVKELTKDLPEANPHDSHLGELDCRECHKIHGPSQLVCASCHNFEFQVP